MLILLASIPAPHSIHEQDPGLGDTVPTGHDWQYPRSVENSPASQNLHWLAPVAGSDPHPQGIHSVAPVPVETVPNGQGRHSPNPEE